MKKPNYKQIFEDIINSKDIEKEQKELLKNKLDDIKDTFSIVCISNILFEKKSNEMEKANQRLKSYCKNDIINILKYQKENNLSDIDLANKYNISLLTIKSWKKKTFSEKNN